VRLAAVLGGHLADKRAAVLAQLDARPGGGR
jgi:hypothetical protein